MSYSISYPCWNCAKAKADPPCTDLINIQNGVSACYTDCKTHQGSGSVVVMCTQVQPYGVNLSVVHSDLLQGELDKRLVANTEVVEVVEPVEPTDPTTIENCGGSWDK